MHADLNALVKRRHDGELPASWLGGPPNFHKAKVIAAVAWRMVKDPSDPDLPTCDLTFQESCIGIAESIMRGNIPDETPFAQKAAELWAEVKDLDLEKTKEITNA